MQASPENAALNAMIASHTITPQKQQHSSHGILSSVGSSTNLIRTLPSATSRPSF